MYKWFTLIIFLVLIGLPGLAFCSGEAATYFNIYVPPSNEVEDMDVALIVTAIDDSTFFNINDTGEDGDTDDSASGMLMAGQSYILYLRDNGVNDDAPHAGEDSAKQDGDHFIITGNKLLLVSEANNADYQHNWLPATNGTGTGQKFYFFANKTSFSPNDINVMAYEDSTFVAVSKISTAATLGQGFTNINLNTSTPVISRMLSPGQDLIYYYTDGRDALQSGQTYMITSNKNVSVQYGALFTDERDGGGYVPSANGTCAGSLFYLTAPFQDSAQQEIRMHSWSNNNNILLERYNAGQWFTVQSFTNVEAMQAVEWTGNIGPETYGTVFRVSCTSGKAITVSESNWVETGGYITSDIAAMVPSDSGISMGTNFLVYMPIPAQQGNIFNTLTQSKMPAKATHAYLFGNKDSVAHVTVKDNFTNGNQVNLRFTIPAGFYGDCILDSAQWDSIYNMNGQMNTGPQRPYLNVQSDVNISVMASNHNDNWAMFYGAGMPQLMDLSSQGSNGNHGGCSGDTVHIVVHCNHHGNYSGGCNVWQSIDPGLQCTGSQFVDVTADSTVQGTVTCDSFSHKSKVHFPHMGDLDPTHTYQIECNVVIAPSNTTAHQLPNNAILSVETNMSGIINGDTDIASESFGIVYQFLQDSIVIIKKGVDTSSNVSSINDLGGEQIRMYPNPAHSRVLIQVPQNAGGVQLQITDMLGQLVYGGQQAPANFSAGEIISVSTANFLPGMYLVQIYCEGKIFNRKLIIE
jgi:hypothetical protein